MPTKPLPLGLNAENLDRLVRDLTEAHQARALHAAQRIREFHPRFRSTTDAAIGEATLTLHDAQLTIAREFGFPSWRRLQASLEHAGESGKVHHERIEDPVFREAVDLLDAGNAAALRAHLIDHPGLIRQRVAFEGGNYFTHPTLLEFVAENPRRRGRLPENIAAIARVILDATRRVDRSSIDATLELVASSRVARECRAQLPLIDVLCEYGADPNAGMLPALLYREFDAVEALIERGARVDLAVAAATGRADEAGEFLPAADDRIRQISLGLAAQHGHVDIVRLLLDAGADPNRYSPVGGHSHATPLHQAAAAGHTDVVQLLVERGAQLDIRDILHHGTPQDWAVHAGHTEIAGALRLED